MHFYDDPTLGMIYEDYVFHSNIIPAYELEVSHTSDTCFYNSGQPITPDGVPDGENFIVLNATEIGSATLETGITLGLSDKLQENKEYVLSFYKRKEDIPLFNPATYNFHLPCITKIGISNDPYEFGELIHTIDTPLVNGWIYEEFSFTSPIEGNYISIQVIPEEGHRGIMLDNFSLQTNVSINELERLVINIHPNPTTDKLNVSSNYIGELKLFNIVGNTLFKQHKSEYQTELDISDLPTGVYFLQLGNSVEKIIKE